MFYGDYHTHTYYSDGRSSLEENVITAINKGLKEIAITDHGYNSPDCGALTREKFKEQRNIIEGLRAIHGDKISILHGIEADIIGLDGSIDILDNELADMEVLIMGYHSFARAISFRDWRKIFVNAYLSFMIKPSKSVIKRNTMTMINAIKRYPIDILAHINHLFKVDCVEVAKACADYGTMIELNAKHLKVSEDTFDKMAQTGVEFIANSDAHRFNAIGGFSGIVDFLDRHSYDINKLANYNKKPEFKRKKIRIKEL